jgi:multidrug resistance efflux pump
MKSDISPLARPSLTGSGVDIPRERPKRTRRYVAYGVIGLVAVVGSAMGLRRLRAAAPTVDSSVLWFGTVKRGAMLREVQGQGTLVPEDIRWITAITAARVERVPVLPGAKVEADTVLIELANPDVQLAALEADRQVSEAQATLANMEATLNGQKLQQESAIATLKSDLGDAKRRAQADEELAKKGYLSELERGQTRDRASEMSGRLDFEQKRLESQQKGIAAQITAQRAQVERLRKVAEFRHQQVDALQVKAGVAGVLQESPLQPGQSVTVGQLLAKVANPTRLKAEVRIPETQAKDLVIGQPSKIDTRNGIIAGKVSRIDPAATQGTVRVDVRLEGELPPGARPDLTVEGTIELENLSNVLYVERPAFGQPHSTVGLFKVEKDGDIAERTPVKLGASSVKTVEIQGGLLEGDKVVLSDMSQWDHTDRIRLR